MGSISQPVSKIYDLTTSDALSNKNIYSYLKMLENVSPFWVSMLSWRAWFTSNQNSTSHIAQPTEGSSRHDIPTLFHHTRRQRDLSKHYVMLISIKWLCCCFKTCTSLPSHVRMSNLQLLVLWEESRTLMKKVNVPAKETQTIPPPCHHVRTHVVDTCAWTCAWVNEGDSSSEPWSAQAFRLNLRTEQYARVACMAPYLQHLVTASQRAEFCTLPCTRQPYLCGLYNCADYGHY